AVRVGSGGGLTGSASGVGVVGPGQPDQGPAGFGPPSVAQGPGLSGPGPHGYGNTTGAGSPYPSAGPGGLSSGQGERGVFLGNGSPGTGPAMPGTVLLGPLGSGTGTGPYAGGPWGQQTAGQGRSDNGPRR